MTAKAREGKMKRIKGISVVAILGAAAACTPALKLTPSDADVVLARQALEAPDPGQAGPYDVLTLYYGAGTDKNRPEYRDSVSITTETVDASKLVSLGQSADERNDYWGFTPKEMTSTPASGIPTGTAPSRWSWWFTETTT